MRSTVQIRPPRPYPALRLSSPPHSDDGMTHRNNIFTNVRNDQIYATGRMHRSNKHVECKYIEKLYRLIPSKQSVKPVQLLTEKRSTPSLHKRMIVCGHVFIFVKYIPQRYS